VKAKCKASIYMPATGILYTESKEYDVSDEMIHAYRGYFEPTGKTGPAPVNKMITAEKETVKAEAPKRGRKKNGV
jgi:hypothetical protein